MSPCVARGCSLNLLILLVALAGCGAGRDDGDKGKRSDTPSPRAEPKIDVTMTLEQFLRDHRKDGPGTEKKYVGKEMQFTAKVWTVRDVGVFPQLDIIAEIHPTLKVPVVMSFPLDENDAGKETKLRLLSRGQEVTIRARGTALPARYGLRDIRIVDSTPSQALVTTLTEVLKAKGNDAALAKYQRREVLLRVKVKDWSTRPVGEIGTVVDPGAPAGSAALPVRAQLLGTFKKELEALKPGDVVTILAGVVLPPESLGLRDARIVKEAPAGLKMPGETAK